MASLHALAASQRDRHSRVFVDTVVVRTGFEFIWHDERNILGSALCRELFRLVVEGYLTTRGDAVNETYRMIEDAGFSIEGNAEYDSRQSDATPGEFRLTGGEGQILKPDIARPR